MRGLMITLAAVLGAAACATTDSNEARQELVEAGSLAGVTEDGERVRCERFRPTGTRMTKRVCYTNREWREIEDGTRRTLEDQSVGRDFTGAAPRDGVGSQNSGVNNSGN